MSERERFEAWATNQQDENGLPCFTVKIGGEYIDRDTKHAWAAWQAACPDGWKCVPVEPTDEMEEVALDAHMPFGDMKLAIQAAIVHAPKPGVAE